MKPVTTMTFSCISLSVRIFSSKIEVKNYNNIIFFLDSREVTHGMLNFMSNYFEILATV